MSKARCRGCGQYKDKAEMIPVGLGYVCDRDCVKLAAERKKSSRKPKKPDVPASVRERVLTRDGYRCRWCGRRTSQLHHIRYRSEGGPHEEWNLVTLCHIHHDKVHSNKKKWKPVLEALIAFGDMGQWLTVPEVERRRERAAEHEGTD